MALLWTRDLCQERDCSNQMSRRANCKRLLKLSRSKNRNSQCLLFILTNIFNKDILEIGGSILSLVIVNCDLFKALIEIY